MPTMVWCVFQRLPEEKCPSLSAVCASAEIAEELVELNRREQRDAGEPEGEWTLSPWTVLDQKIGEVDEADRISHVLDPMRAGVAVPAGEDGGEA